MTQTAAIRVRRAEIERDVGDDPRREGAPINDAPIADGPPLPVSSQPAPWSPASWLSLARPAACIAVSLLLWLTQGLGMNLVAVNTTQIQGALGATLNETNWLVAAYMAPNVSLTILLTKIRTQFGLRRFAEISIAVFAAAAVLHLFAHDLQSAVAVRFLAGIVAAPVSSLGFLYMMDAFPPARKMTWGLSMALTCSSATPSVARLMSPMLLDIAQWQSLYTLELGLALAALAAVYLLPLTPVPHAKVLARLDFITYPLIAVGFGLLAIVLALGRYYWWLEAPWIGVCLALAVATIGLAAAIELNRQTPLMNVRWLTSPEIVHFALVLLVFRIVLAEQTTGAVGLFQMLGLLNEQSAALYGLILLASFAGGALCAATLRGERVPALHGLALICIAAGAWMDGHATYLTRPSDMMLSQALIAFGGALFLPPAMLAGMTKTLKQGQAYVTSFIVVFLFTQGIGGLVGSAFFGTFIIVREKFHSSQLVEQVVLSNPLVAERVRQIGAAYGRVLTDPQLLNAEGVALLSQLATREANVLAYNDAFLLIAAIATAAFVGLVLHTAYARLGAWLAAARPARSEPPPAEPAVGLAKP